MCIRASYAAVRFNAHGSADGIRRPLDTQCPFLFPENPLGIWEDLNTLNIFHHSIWSFADSAGAHVPNGKRRKSCHSTKTASIPAIKRIRTAIKSPGSSSTTANHCSGICLEMKREMR